MKKIKIFGRWNIEDSKKKETNIKVTVTFIKKEVSMNQNVCPICERVYGEGSSHPRRKSKHHIFPKRWYPDSTVTVDVCQKCHDDFNATFMCADCKSNRRWSKVESVRFWISFCYLHDKVATRIYPELLKYV